jgi:uncharacterized membrane protein required for colicin V production
MPGGVVLSYRSGRPTPAAATINKTPAVLLFLAVAAFIAADIFLNFEFNWIDYVLVIVIALFGFRGYLKGLINTVFSLGGYILGLIGAYIFSPKLALITMQKTSLGKSIGEKLNGIIPALSSINAIKINDSASTMDIISNNPSMGGIISQNTFLKQVMSITNTAAETGSMYSDTVVTVNDLIVFSLLKVIALVVLFFVIKLLLVLLGKLISYIFNSTAILGTANRTGGMLVGFGVGLIICYVVFVFAVPILGSLKILDISKSYEKSIMMGWLNSFVRTF